MVLVAVARTPAGGAAELRTWERARVRVPRGGPRAALPQQRRGAARLAAAAENGATAAATPPRQLESLGPAVVTDAAVPEGHQGLHGFLYGEGGAEAHGKGSALGAAGGYTFRQGEDDGSTLLEVSGYLESRDGEKPVGVYGLYDAQRNLQYVSYSRSVPLAVKTHLGRVGEDRCAFVRVMVFANRAMQSRSALQREAENWLGEAGTTPPGNGAEQALWEGQAAFDPAHMSAAELEEYEDKKLKMRKAMGESLQDGAEDEAIDSKERRLRMIAAVEGDNWSAVIGDQTSQTRGPGAGLAAAASGSSEQQAESSKPAAGPVVTPFARAAVHRAVGSGEQQAAVLSVESVDKALDEVRPYLMADGGDVTVMSVENGNVFLRLDGACSTCASSSATMKMGVERALRAAFGEQLKEVMQVGGSPAAPAASVESVDMHLNMLRGAIAAYGGTVEVVSVEGGVCTMRYKGPEPIGYGLSAATRDKFPELKDIVLLDADSGEPLQLKL